MFRFLLVVCFLFVACVPPTFSANCHVHAVQNIAVPVVQQIIAVPVQPYYFSYQGQVSTGNTQSIKAPAERDYLTKQEFLEAMKLLLAEQRGDAQYLVENNPEEQKLKELVNNRCMSCHSTPTGKWPGTQATVNFFDANGKWDSTINWDRMVTVTISGKMPKGGQRLSPQECEIIIKKAEKASNVPPPPPPAQQQQVPPIPGNY